MLQKLLFSTLAIAYAFLFYTPCHGNAQDQLPLGHWIVAPGSTSGEVIFHDGSKYFAPLFSRSTVAKWTPGDEVEATFYEMRSNWTWLTFKNINKKSSVSLALSKIPETPDQSYWISIKEQAQITLNNGVSFKALDLSIFFGLSSVTGSKLVQDWKEGDLITILLTDEPNEYDLLNLTLWQVNDLASIRRCVLVQE